MKKYIYKKYEPQYKRLFYYERNIIKNALGKNVQVEHVGSTAVKGLGGKGIIDILIGTKRKDIYKAKLKLERAGYEYRAVASVPGRIFFKKDYYRKGVQRRVHLHLVEYNSKQWTQVINFRDYLKNNPSAVSEYIKIKKQAVKTAKGDGKIYREMKEGFIKAIIKKS